MVFKKIVRGIIGLFHGLEHWSTVPEEKVYKIEESAKNLVDEIHSVWDYLKLKPNSQALHLSSVLGFDEWIDMGEIRRRIKELFSIEYKNERSLYPYLKTLTDMGLVENSSIGGRMKWRKHDLLIKINKEGPEKKVEIVEARAVKKKEKRGE